MKLPIIVNEAGKTYIEAVPQLGWGKGKECTFIGALEAALSVTATPHNYDNLMGWSALAFRTRWYRGSNGRRWCPSSPVGECQEEMDMLRTAIGWELPAVCSLEGIDRTPADYASTIAQEIRAGRPVLAYEPQLNVSVVYGFEDEGNILLLRDYMSDEPTTRLPISKLGSFLCFLGRQVGTLRLQEAIDAGLTQAVANWHRSHTESASGRHWYGRAALLKWREDLQHADVLDTEARRLLFFVNWWVFDCLADSRASAERFLRRHSEAFEGRQHRHLTEAIQVFHEESQLLRRILTEKECFLGPWTGRNADHWSTAIRHREIDIINHVLALETRAFGELENMLEAAALAPAGPEYSRT